MKVKEFLEKLHIKLQQAHQRWCVNDVNDLEEMSTEYHEFIKTTLQEIETVLHSKDVSWESTDSQLPKAEIAKIVDNHSFTCRTSGNENYIGLVAILRQLSKESKKTGYLKSEKIEKLSRQEEISTH